jgi:precorrin-6A synthase
MRASLFARLIEHELGENQSGAFLIWGDPSLYDSTLRILARVEALGVQFEYRVIPGISSVQALAARHRIPLNRIGEPIVIMPGRHLANEPPARIDNLVVMLDAHCRFAELADEHVHIYWGAYLGTADEILIAGRLQDVKAQILEAREVARQRKGWIMDTYLLRRPLPEG